MQLFCFGLYKIKKTTTKKTHVSSTLAILKPYELDKEKIRYMYYIHI